jgi:hypothetical protein
MLTAKRTMTPRASSTGSEMRVDNGGAIRERPSVGKVILKLPHNAGRSGHVYGLFCGLLMCRWP